jgi:hypothetical protein
MLSVVVLSVVILCIITAMVILLRNFILSVNCLSVIILCVSRLMFIILTGITLRDTDCHGATDYSIRKNYLSTINQVYYSRSFCETYKHYNSLINFLMK